MSQIAASLGMLAMLQLPMAAGGALPTAPARPCHDRHHAPSEAPDLPAGCHATLNCAAHRKARTMAD